MDQTDPTLTGLFPGTAPASGGSFVTLAGSHFTPTMQVWFLADAAEDAVPAASVAFVDASTLRVETPAHATGVVSVLVSELNGCGVFAESSFTFLGEHSGSGGGCSIASVQGPSDPRAWLEGGWWLLAVFGYLVLRSSRARTTAIA